MRRGIVLGVVLLSLVGTVPGAVGSQTGVFVSDTETAPRSPTVGEAATITVALTNPTITDYEVESVTLQTADGEPLERREPDTTIDAESDGTVRLTRTFDEPGTRDLTVVIRGTRGGVPVTVRADLTVEVDAVGGPDAALVTSDAVAGTETTVSVSFANPADERLRDVSVRLDGAFDANRSRYVLPSVAGGVSRTFDFGVTFAEPGERTVTAVIEYVTADGRPRELVREVAVEVAEPRRRASVSARTGDGARPPVVATVRNLGNVPLDDPLVVVRDESGVVGRATLDDLAAGESRTVAVNVSGVNGSVTVGAAYTAAGTDGRAETTLEYTTNPARISLTGVEASRSGDRVRLSGSASNVGMAPAESVLVSVVGEPGVEPTGPNPEFFVGRVGASEFVSFEVTADVAANRTEIPVRVTWIADGRRQSAVTTVTLDAQSTPAAEPTGGVPSTSVLVGAGAVGLLVVGLMGYGLYNSLS